MAMRKLPSLTTAELQKIVSRWDDGSGVTAAVRAFAQAVPVAERTVWYWIGGRKIHPAMAERIRSMEPPRKPPSHEYGTIQGKPVRPFLQAACDELAKRMGERILSDCKAALQGKKRTKVKPDNRTLKSETI